MDYLITFALITRMEGNYEIKALIMFSLSCTFPIILNMKTHLLRAVFLKLFQVINHESMNNVWQITKSKQNISLSFQPSNFIVKILKRNAAKIDYNNQKTYLVGLGHFSHTLYQL